MTLPILASTHLSNATVEIAHSTAEITIPVGIYQCCVHRTKMDNAMYIVMMVTMPVETQTSHVQLEEIVYSNLEGGIVIGMVGLGPESMLHVKRAVLALSSVQELIACIMVTSVLIHASLAQENMVNALWSVLVMEFANFPILLWLQ